MASSSLKFLYHTRRSITVGRILSRRAAIDLRLRPRGSWDRQSIIIQVYAPKMKYTVPMNMGRTSDGVMHGYGVEGDIQTASCPNTYSARSLNVMTQNLVPSLRICAAITSLLSRLHCVTLI